MRRSQFILRGALITLIPFALLIVPPTATATPAKKPLATTSQAKKPSTKSKPKPKPAASTTTRNPYVRPAEQQPDPVAPSPPASASPNPLDQEESTQAPPPPPPSSGGICDIDPSACPKPRFTLPHPPQKIGSESTSPPPVTAPPPTHVAPQVAEAQWQLAIALANAKLTQGSIRVLAGIAQNPLHPHHRDALARLGLFARDMPDGSDLDRAFLAASPEVVNSIPRDAQNARSAALYLFGKHRYATGAYRDAANVLAAVDDADPLKPRALFYEGAAHVQLQSSVPAVKAFQHARVILDAAPPSVDRTLLNELAVLALARTYYSAAIRRDENNMPTIDSMKMSAAALYYEKVNPGTTLWPDAAFELSWAFLTAGDFSRADGHARFLSSDASNGAHAFEARTIRAVISFSHCQYDDAQKQVIALNKLAEQIQPPLLAMIKRTAAEGEDAFANLVLRPIEQLQDPPLVKQVVGRARLDWRISRRIAYLARVDAEARLLNSIAASLASQPVLVAEARAAVDAERARVIRTISTATREFLEREHDAIAEAMLDSQRVLIDVTAATRNQLDAAKAGGQVSVAESRMILGKAQDPQQDPFERRLPDHVRRYQTGLFYTLSATKCGR